MTTSSKKLVAHSADEADLFEEPIVWRSNPPRSIDRAAEHAHEVRIRVFEGALQQRIAPLRIDVICAFAAPTQIKSGSKIRNVMLEQLRCYRTVGEQAMT